MPSTLEKYFQLFSNKKSTSKKDIVYFITKIKKVSKNLSIKGKTKLDLEKAKLDLRKNYYKLGMYITNKFTSDNIYDFSYDDKFEELIAEIKSLKSYIHSLSNKKK